MAALASAILCFTLVFEAASIDLAASWDTYT